ncbi:hypothetical protein V8D89_004868 [Ganoderma adspersum]
MSEKLSRDLRTRSRAVPSASATTGGINEQAAGALDVSIPPGHGPAENRRAPRYETDGGVRLAGGRAGEVAMDNCDRDEQNTSEGGYTLPPPYSSDFGEA